MPPFHNATKTALDFEIARERYQVPPGAECVIPQRYVYCVGAFGLPLTPGHAPGKGARVVESTPVEPARAILPGGVAVGLRERTTRRGAPEPEPDPADEEPAEEDDALVGVVGQLRAQGVQLPGRGKAS